MTFTRLEFEEMTRTAHRFDCYFSAIHVFPQGSAAFESASSEEVIRVIKGPVSRFQNLLHFYLTCVDLIPDYSHRQNAVFSSIPPRTISAIKIENRIKLTGREILDSVGFQDASSFGDGVVLTDEWNEQLTVWSNAREEYIAYYWTTTA